MKYENGYYKRGRYYRSEKGSDFFSPFINYETPFYETEIAPSEETKGPELKPFLVEKRHRKLRTSRKM